LDAVESTIRKATDDALQEMNTSLNEANKLAAETIDAAEQEAHLMVSRILETKDKQADMLRRQIIDGAEITSRRKSLEMVEEEVNNVFKNALQKLEAVDREEYTRALKRFLEQSIDLIGGESLVISGSKRDQQILREVAQEVGKERRMEIKVDRRAIECSGGLKAETPDGSILYDDTFETRIERLRPVLRKQLADLFGARIR